MKALSHKLRNTLCALFIMQFVAGTFLFAGEKSSVYFHPVLLGDTLSKPDSATIELFQDSGSLVPATAIPADGESVHARDFDRIFTARGESLVVKVTGVNVFEVLYTWPLNTLEQRIPKEEVTEVVYADGRREGFKAKVVGNKNEIKDWAVVVSEKDWERVLAVDSTASLGAVTMLGSVSARYEGSKINSPTDYLEKSAMIILKKKAARLGSNVVLVTERKEYRAYGELPSVELTGTAYLKNQ
ncbi:MAG: hypothetical protein U0T82_04980 [Bacteroidales bacterium]